MTMEDALRAKLQNDGYHVTNAPDNTKGYTFEAKKGDDCVAVRVKEHKAKVNVATVQQFQEYLDLPMSKQRFNAGWLISANGFFNPALTHVQREEPADLRLGIFSDG